MCKHWWWHLWNTALRFWVPHSRRILRYEETHKATQIIKCLDCMFYMRQGEGAAVTLSPKEEAKGWFHRSLLLPEGQLQTWKWPDDIAKQNGHSLWLERLIWGIRKIIVTKKVVQCLNRLPWTVLGLAPLEFYKTQPKLQPTWSHAGKQIYFQQNVNKMAIRKLFKTTFFI